MKRVMILAALALVAGPALAAPPVVGKTDKGEALVDAAGMSLYTFDKDGPGQSACEGECAEYWPPALAAAGDKAGPGFSAIARPDGAQQWAYKDKPLYTWTKDSAPGETTGDGVKGVWHLARP
ncbi:MAG: hypothetical protein Q4615_03490 [Paracoccus aminovorans]|nr:hypothetical protein [Paracoccus aminovorans]